MKLSLKDEVFKKLSTSEFRQLLLFIKQKILTDPSVWDNFSETLFDELNKKARNFYIYATKDL